MELEDKVLVIQRVRVRYTLRGCPPDKVDAAERAHQFHASRCPVVRSIGGCIDISTSLAYA